MDVLFFPDPALPWKQAPKPLRVPPVPLYHFVSGPKEERKKRKKEEKEEGAFRERRAFKKSLEVKALKSL